MDARAEQIVLDYLRVLEEAAQRKLGPAEQQPFLARTRAAIARQVSQTRVDDARDIKRLLRRFGDPRKLAARERRRLDGGPPAARPGAAKDWMDGLVSLVRRHPLECAAIAVLGVGGLIDPYPVWMVGSLAVLASKLWDTRDKLIAVAAPMAIALLGAIMLGGLNGKTASLAGYAHGMHTDGLDLIRAGAVLGAMYLSWRVRQGPRPRQGPPWQQTRRG